MNIIKKWISKRKAKREELKKKMDDHYTLIAKVHLEYINETGLQPTEFRMKMDENTDHFNEWLNKNYKK